MTAWIRSTTSGGPRPSRGRRARARDVREELVLVLAARDPLQPGTTSPHLNCFIGPPGLMRRSNRAAGGPAAPSTIGACAGCWPTSVSRCPCENLLFDTDNSLVRQSYSPRMMNTFLNLAGFGMQAWDPASLRPEDPFTYRATTLPSFDRNLRVPRVQAGADVPGRPRSRRHVLARGGRRRDEPAPLPASPAPASCSRTTGTCASSRACATRSSSTCGRSSRSASRGRPTRSGSTRWSCRSSTTRTGCRRPRELADATAAALRILRDVRAAHGIDTSSPVNLCVSTGRSRRRHPLLVRLRLVPARGRDARDRPPVREPLVRDRRRVRRARRRAGR